MVNLDAAAQRPALATLESIAQALQTGAALPSLQPPLAQPAQPSVPLPPIVAAPTKRVGRKSGGRRNAADIAEPEELVKLGAEVSRNSERLRTGWHPVRLSEEDKAVEVELDKQQLTASSAAGYRMVRATHGAHSGTWYFEMTVNRLGATGAVRVGWSRRQAEVNAPVGADIHGFAYRSMQGSKVHKGWREEYGRPYGEGDVVGCLLHMPEGGRPLEKGAEDAVKYKGKLYFQEEQEPSAPRSVPGSFVAFTLNGRLQGKAYADILEGTYCPAISLYTNKMKQTEAASVTVNFGDREFAFPPPQLDGCPPPRPACQLAGPPPGQAVAQQAQQEQQEQQPAKQPAAGAQQQDAAQTPCAPASQQRDLQQQDQQRRQTGRAEEQGGAQPMEEDGSQGVTAAGVVQQQQPSGGEAPQPLVAGQQLRPPEAGL